MKQEVLVHLGTHERSEDALAAWPAEVEHLRKIGREEQADKLEKNLEILRWSCGNIRAVRMAALCTELEAIGRSEDLAAVPVRISRLEEEFGRVRAAFEGELAKK
ncbi:MAG TPA: hypothetical protein VGR18_10335 [Rubrobacter sp.]|nr:hypothetical protein [Rubrobacter sp.]